MPSMNWDSCCSWSSSVQWVRHEGSLRRSCPLHPFATSESAQQEYALGGLQLNHRDSDSWDFSIWTRRKHDAYNSFTPTVLRFSVARGHSAAFLFAVAETINQMRQKKRLFLCWWCRCTWVCHFFPKDWHLRPTSATILSESLLSWKWKVQNSF